MMRSNPATSMQKCYDDCFLVCSTAIYFEQQNNEAEALRSWKNALDQIYYHNAYRQPSNYRPKTETEKALQTSLRQMELQCKERVDLLEALKQSRAEAEEGKADSGVDNSFNSTASVPTNISGGTWLGSGTIPPISYPDLAKPPALPQRPGQPVQRVSSRGSRPKPITRTSQASEQNANLLTPSITPVDHRRSRTPSPEKKGGMLKTLRQGRKSGGSSSKPKTSLTRSQPPIAAAGAATSAWSSGSRPTSQRSSITESPSAAARSSLRASIPSNLPFPQSTSDSLGRVLQTRSQENATLDVELNNKLSVSDDRTPRRRDDRPLGPRGPSYNTLMPPSDQFSDGSLLKTSSAPTPASAPRRRSKSPLRLSNAAPPTISYRNEFPKSPAEVDPQIAIEQARRLRGLGPASSASAAMPTSPTHIKRKMVDRRPQANTKIVRNNRTTSDDDLSSSGNDRAPPLVPIKPGRFRAEDQIETSPLTPSTDVSADLDSNDAEAEWQEKIARLLKKLPRGVDELAAKQILNEIVIKGDEVHWADVAGLDIAKNALKETVVYPFLRPDLFSGLREPAKGMLLFGPPGTGKTMLARAVATESRSTFFAISASSLTSKFLGESEKLVRALFTLAKELAPSIIFVDEIDSLLSTRADQGEHEATRRIKTEFLIQWSDLARAAAGSENNNKERGDASRVLVLAATNLPWAIDDAARRRFVRRQYIPLPEEEVRATQLKTLLSHQKHSLTPRDLTRLVALTEGFSGSDITALAKDAAMGPLRSLGDRLLHTAMDEIRPIGFQDFQASLITIRPSVSKQGLKQFEDWATEYGERGG